MTSVSAVSELQVIRRADAKAAELVRYATGKPCKRGHVAERFVGSATCCACEADRQSDPTYKAAHAARERQRMADTTNKAAKNEQRRKRRADDPNYRAAEAEQKCQRYANDPDWRAAHAAKVAAWARANPDKKRDYSHRRRATKLGNGVGLFTKEDREALWVLQGGLCNNQLCEADLSATGCHEDHKIPLKLGGLHDFYNMQLLCPTCNTKKHALPWDVFLERYFDEVVLGVPKPKRQRARRQLPALEAAGAF